MDSCRSKDIVSDKGEELLAMVGGVSLPNPSVDRVDSAWTTVVGLGGLLRPSCEFAAVFCFPNIIRRLNKGGLLDLGTLGAGDGGDAGIGLTTSDRSVVTGQSLSPKGSKNWREACVMGEMADMEC